MILLIDTTQREKIILGIFIKNLELFEFNNPYQSEDLLSLIDQTIKSKNRALKNLEGIIVNVGPGSYTGTRIGVTTANTLAWSLNVPVLGYSQEKIEQALEKVKGVRCFSSIVLPTY